MPFCISCGTEFRPPSRFCSNCGAAMPAAPGSDSTIATNANTRTPQELPYYISLKRVLFMTALSYGLYLFYWLYITWKQYRDHAEEDAFPVWHSLTLLVPVYGLFRVHAHMRSFKELMLNANIHSSISPGWAVFLLLVTEVLTSISLRISGGFTGFVLLTQGIAILGAILDITGIVLVSGLILHVQRNLNRYWDGLTNGGVTTSRIGVGEVIFGIIGALAWLDTLTTVFNESRRLGW